MQENEITDIVINRSIRVHSTLGPGLLESVYEEALAYELAKQGLGIERQKPIPVKYDTVKLDIGFRADLIMERKVIVELKSVENILPVHRKQLLTYLKLSGIKVGLLINFNEVLLKDGIARLIEGNLE